MNQYRWLVRSIVILCALSGVPSHAAQYYVSAKGDDANPGTRFRPWKTIARSNRVTLRPGDRVLFEAGSTFAGTIQLDSKVSGTKSKTVEITSYGKGRAAINGGNGAGLVASGCSHLIVRELNFIGSGRKQGNTKEGVSVADGDGIELDHLDVSGFRSSGVSVSGVRRTRITYVYAHENGACGIGCGGEEGRPLSGDLYIGHCVAENNPGDPSVLTNHSGNGIVVGYVKKCLIEYCEAMNNGWDMPWHGNGPVGIWAWNADQVTIQFCVAHDNKSTGYDGGGFDFDGGVTNSILQYNYSYNNVGPGYFLCQYPTGPVWRNNIVRYNISVNDGYKNNVGCGIEIYGGDFRMSDAQVYSNTVYNAKGGAVGFGAIPVPGVVFRNNIFVSAGDIIRGDPGPSRFEGNCYWPIGRPGSFPDHAKTFEEWVTATGQEKVGGAVVGMYAGPRLVTSGAVPSVKPEKLAGLKAYRLRAGSPCIGAGLLIPRNGGRDFWGNKVPSRRKPCIGAHEAG
jgi:hypothetical protein